MKKIIFQTVATFIFCLNLLSAEIPSMINYQGILTNDNGTVVDDNTYNLSFSIYDVASGGSELWSETHSGVEVTQGLFNIMLGSVSSLGDIPFDMQYYLEIAVDGDVMTDRIAFSSTAYSLNSRAVNGNQGIPAGGIIMWSGSEIPDGWALCDGTNGTPDLIDIFIIGANSSTVNESGGSSTHGHSDNFSVAYHALTVAEMPSHNHSLNPGLELRTQGTDDGSDGDIDGVRIISNSTNYTGSSQPHDHGLNGDIENGDNIPPYYALAFIIKL